MVVIWQSNIILTFLLSRKCMPNTSNKQNVITFVNRSHFPNALVWGEFQMYHKVAVVSWEKVAQRKRRRSRCLVLRSAGSESSFFMVTISVPSKRWHSGANSRETYNRSHKKHWSFSSFWIKRRRWRTHRMVEWPHILGSSFFYLDGAWARYVNGS